MLRCARNDGKHWLTLAMFCLLALAALTPGQAFAYNFTRPIPVGVINPVTGIQPVCPSSTGLTRALVPCIKENIIYAVNAFLGPLSIFFADAVSAACLLAVLFWAAGLITGRHRAMTRDGIMLALKIGGVGAFTANFGASLMDPTGAHGGFFGMMLDAMDSMLTMVTTYVGNSDILVCQPAGVETTFTLIIWDRVDCAINTLVGGILPINGVLAPYTISLGIAGFLVGCLFSTPVGFFIAMLGFYMVMLFLFAIARAVYVYISSYIAFAVMVIISPLFIPMILFTVTKPYFEKWLRLTIGFALQPIILFAYLAMLLAAFDTVVYSGEFSLATAIAGRTNVQNVIASGNNFEIGAWVNNVGGYAEQSMNADAVNVDPGAAERALGAPDPLDTGLLGTVGRQASAQLSNWQNGIFDYLGIGNATNANGQTDLRFFKLDWPVWGINWDALAAADSDAPNTLVYLINLVVSLGMVLVTAYIFTTLLDILPFIGSGVAERPIGMPTLGMRNAGGQDMSPPGSGMMDKLKSTMGNFMTGGAR